MYDQSKVLLVKDSIKLLKGRVQGHLVEGIIHRATDGILECDLALQDLGLEAAKSGHSNDGSVWDKNYSTMSRL